MNAWETISSWTGGKVFTPDSPDAVVADFLTAINDIRDNPNFPDPPEPQSTPEPNLILGFFVVGLSTISYSKRF
ncbi:MAG: hypothetical protein QNJ37_24755 [Crocosphaera sp.]|nr:hypothetical protein [Crocosphaera sp.]